MALINQSLEEFDVQEEIQLLTPGWYDAVIVDSRAAQKEKGLYVQFDFDVIGHPNHVFDGMSLGSEYGCIKLKTLANKALKREIDFIGDSEELHGKYITIKVAIQTDETGKYDPKNVIKSYKEYTGSGSSKSIGSTKKSPWEK